MKMKMLVLEEELVPLRVILGAQVRVAKDLLAWCITHTATSHRCLELSTNCCSGVACRWTNVFPDYDDAMRRYMPGSWIGLCHRVHMVSVLLVHMCCSMKASG